MPSSNPPNRVKLTPQETARRRDRLVSLIVRLPATTVTKHGLHQSLEVRGKRFGWCLEDHHGDGRLALHCKAPRGAAETLRRQDPQVYHVPKYLGHRGWIGLWLDLPAVDWSAVEQVILAAYRLTAPKSLVASLVE